MRALLGGFALSIVAAAPPPSGGTPAVLGPGAPVERTLAAGDSHEYAIALARGELLHALVDQRGLDTVEELFDPEGRRVLRVDSPRGSYGPEPIWLVAERAGEYRMRVSPLVPGTRGGYAIRVEEVRPSAARDRLRAEAAQLSAKSRNFEELTTARARAESLGALDRSADLWAQTGDAREEALALFDVGRAHQFHGEFLEAMGDFLRAEERAAAAGDTQLRAKILNALGLSTSYRGDAGAALDLFVRAAGLAREAGDPQGESAALHGQAYGRWNTGAYQEALELDRRALAIARSLEDRELEGWSLWGLGLTDLTIGEFDRSIRESHEAIAAWRGIQNSYGEAATLQNLGFAYWLVGRRSEARETYRQALSVMREVGDRQGEALALNNLGLAETDLGDPSAAARTLEEAVALWRTIGSKHGEALSLRNLGHALERLGRTDEAARSYRQCMVVARNGGDAAAEANALGSLALLESRSGDLDAAREHATSALAILESQRGGLVESRLKSSFLSAHQDYYATALDIQLQLHARDPGAGHDAEAFGISERGRARALAEAIVEARLDLSGDLPEDMRRRERELSAEIDRLQKGLSTASDPSAAERRLRGAEEEWDRLLTEMRRTAPRYAALRYPDALSDREARALVGPSEALVSYSLQTDPPAVFVLTAKGLAARRLPVSADDLRERVENYVGLLARDDANRWSALSSELYRDLVAPWRDELPESVRRLVIVPDGVLHSLPFEALVRPGSRPRRLLEDFAVSYVPSATVLRELSAPRTTAGDGAPADLLVVAAPAVGALPGMGEEIEGETFDLSPLPNAAAEARSIGRFGGPASEIDVGADASESRIKGRSLERFGILHFATHALLSRRVPSRSALLLASDRGTAGLLTVREIHRLKLRSDLVVLSACQTAQGRILAGEGVQSLARAFFFAGARSLVASLWDVGDRRTAPLMTAFYRRLAGGSTKAEALREAKLEMLRQSPGLAPRYWAPFVLIGEPNARVSLHEPGRDWRVAGAAAAAVVGGLIWALLRRQRRARSKGKGPSFSAPAAVSTSTVQK
jgi:CHAT domain-containing protein/Tfp pilus assembly protein PilF